MIHKNKEQRIVSTTNDYIARALEEEGKKIIEGYAAVFNQKSKLLFENGKEFYEVIENTAFDEILTSDYLDVILTYQHNTNEPLARLNAAKGVQTLSLEVDEYGLKFRANLNNTTVANDTFERVKNGECFECSFIFTVDSSNERWELEDGENIRYISKVSGLYDVAVVVDGAYANTDVKVAERSYNQHVKEEKKELPIETYMADLEAELIFLSI